MTAIRVSPILLALGALLALEALPVASAAPPTGHFVVSGTAPDDVVTDTHTGLVWQRTLSQSSYTQADAAAYCASLGGGYRLPEIAELQSIADETRASPAADPSAFPGTPNDSFWSSSVYVSGVAMWWKVDFTHGDATVAPATTTYRVRCVR